MEASQTPEPAARIDAAFLLLPMHNWRWFMLRGVLAILLGIMALLVPGLTVFAFALLFGAFSFADGILSLIAGIRGATNKADRWGMLVFSGVVGIAVGVIFFVWPLLAAATYAFFLVFTLAFWAMVTGVMEIAAAIRLRRSIEGEWLLGLAGALSLLLGVAILYMLMTAPGASLISLGWLIGIYALASGIALVMLALRLKGKAA
ncbi:HdeD family acid-resistance protein [Altererythrobacter sp. CC-YST694]|uniref:HdeD family acid-resistance protein n=1 Tax=Altererythrobacter sp. CC-YST694 TaxID=2755038 RepID=UPI001D010D78|nr:DUF308 domain-containing protein [Altererythrobacter sp. CC-YST694]